MLDIDKAKIAEMWKAGVRRKKIAEAVGCSAPYITTIAEQMGLDFRRPRTLSVPNSKRFRKLWDDGVPSAEIAETLGVSYLTIKRAAEAYGYPKRANMRGRVKPKQKNSTKAKPDPFPGVTGLDRAILLSGGKYAALAEIAADESNGLTMTHARIKWFRLNAEHGGRA